MIGTEQQYYLYLTRLDHPVFAKVYADTVDSTTPLNSIMNRVMARQLVRMKTALDDLRANCFAYTATLTLIGNWELTYFGVTNPSLTLTTRINRLLARINSSFDMSVNTVISLSIALTGQTPRVLRTLKSGGWLLGISVLGLDTITSGNNPTSDGPTYLVIFDQTVDSASLRQLDQELTAIQKGGSNHFILASPARWVLGQSVLGVGTILG